MVQIIDEGSSPLPVLCETNPTGLGGVVVYDDDTYALPSIRIVQPEESSLPPPNGALSVYNSTAAMDQQWSLEETYNRDETLLFLPHGYLTSGGSQLSPFYQREATVPNTWWSLHSPLVVMTLAGVMTMLFSFVKHN